MANFFKICAKLRSARSASHGCIPKVSSGSWCAAEVLVDGPGSRNVCGDVELSARNTLFFIFYFLEALPQAEISVYMLMVAVTFLRD